MNPSQGRQEAGFILKVLVASAGLSLLIKYGGPILSIPETPTTALLFVLVPTLVMAIALLLRYTSASAKP